MTRDLRKYSRQTNFRLIIGTILILFVVGLGLIAIIYGVNAALLGLLCLLGALIPIGLIALLLFGLDFFVKRINRN
jgi:heme A synthase